LGCWLAEDSSLSSDCWLALAEPFPWDPWDAASDALAGELSDFCVSCVSLAVGGGGGGGEAQATTQTIPTAKAKADLRCRAKWFMELPSTDYTDVR